MPGQRMGEGKNLTWEYEGKVYQWLYQELFGFRHFNYKVYKVCGI